MIAAGTANERPHDSSTNALAIIVPKMLPTLWWARQMPMIIPLINYKLFIWNDWNHNCSRIFTSFALSEPIANSSNAARPPGRLEQTGKYLKEFLSLKLLFANYETRISIIPEQRWSNRRREYLPNRPNRKGSWKYRPLPSRLRGNSARSFAHQLIHCNRNHTIKIPSHLRNQLKVFTWRTFQMRRKRGKPSPRHRVKCSNHFHLFKLFPRLLITFNWFEMWNNCTKRSPVAPIVRVVDCNNQIRRRF